MKDEVGTLGSAFNRMTRRLEEQTGALVSANSQLDSRRAFIEAVLSGVTAGVISVDHHRQVRLINSSAEALLKMPKDAAVGQKLPCWRRSSTPSSTPKRAKTSSNSRREASRGRWRSSA